MISFEVQCWSENVALVYDPATHTTSDAPGVETRIPGFGNTSLSVEWIDKSMRGFSMYFSEIVAKILPQVTDTFKGFLNNCGVGHCVGQGYVRGENLHGAPYDFRRAANEHGEYFERLKQLVEDTYTKGVLSTRPLVRFFDSRDDLEIPL